MPNCKGAGLKVNSEPLAVPRPVIFPKYSFGPVKKDLNWSYGASELLGKFFLEGSPLKNVPKCFWNK